MNRKLVKIAFEFNESMETIANQLQDGGYFVELKPTSLITGEMYDFLRQKLQASRAIKEQADRIKVGHGKKQRKRNIDNPKKIKTQDKTKSVKSNIPKDRLDGIFKIGIENCLFGDGDVTCTIQGKKYSTKLIGSIKAYSDLINKIPPKELSNRVEIEIKQTKLVYHFDFWDLIIELRDKHRELFSEIPIFWKEVDFFDHGIEFTLFDLKHRVPVVFFHEAYNEIKEYLHRLLPPILVHIENDRITKYMNFNTIKDLVVEYCAPSNIPTYTESIHELLRPYQMITIGECTRIASKHNRMKAPISLLLDWHNKDYGIIYLKEIQLSNDSLIKEDSFLFTVKQGDYDFLIFENVNENRATYLFKYLSKDRIKYLGKIAEYLTSSDPAKRYNLQFNNKVQKALNFHTRIIHSTDKQWERELKRSLSRR